LFYCLVVLRRLSAYGTMVNTTAMIAIAATIPAIISVSDEMPAGAVDWVGLGETDVDVDGVADVDGVFDVDGVDDVDGVGVVVAETTK